MCSAWSVLQFSLGKSRIVISGPLCSLVPRRGGGGLEGAIQSLFQSGNLAKSRG